MRIEGRLAVAVVFCAMSIAAPAEPRFSGTVAAFADDHQGRSVDVDAAFSAADWYEAGIGASSTEARSSLGHLNGTALRAFADVHGERLGFRGYYRRWNSSALDVETLGARANLHFGELTLSAIAETQGLDVDYSADGTQANRDTAHFSGSAWGAGARYGWASWSAYGEGLFYQHGSLSRYAVSQVPSSSNPPPSGSSSTPIAPLLPSLPTLPVLPAPTVPATPPPSAILPLPDLGQSILYGVPTLAGSYVTLNQAVVERMLAAGVERNFDRSALRLDWSGVRETVLRTQINSFSATYRLAFTQQLQASLTLGVSESHYGSVNFGGLSFGFTL